MTALPILHTLEEIDAEIARRRPLWKPQHAEGCEYHWTRCACTDPTMHDSDCGFVRPMPSDEQWRAKPCECPQAMAFYSLADITGYGGAAGGGKSSLAIGLSLTRHRNSAIFRKEKDDGHDLYEDTCRFVQDSGARTNENLKLVRDIPGDRQVRFFGVKNPGDEQKFRGRARDYFAFDETTEFSESVVRFLIGWNRSTIPGQRCRVVLPFNPPSIRRGQWLRSYFGPWLDPKHPKYPTPDGVLRWYTRINDADVECDGPELVEVTERDGRVMKVKPLSRTFIHATLDDNAYLRDTNYRAMLQALPEPLRSQLLYGDMNAEESDDAHQLIPTRWVMLAQDRWLKRNGKPTEFLSALGSDPAHGGDDDNVIAPRIGPWFDHPAAKPGKQTPDGRDTIKFLAEVGGRYRIAPGGVPVGMDTIGVGASPRDLAKDTSMRLVAMNGAGRDYPDATDRSGILNFANNRAYWWWRFREALDPELGEDLELPPDQELLVDLTAPHYDLTTRGIVVEDKDDIRKKIHRSPGKGDAVVYAYNVRPMQIGYRSTGPASPAQSSPALGGRIDGGFGSRKGF